jgi:hypothetical protein
MLISDSSRRGHGVTKHAKPGNTLSGGLPGLWPLLRQHGPNPEGIYSSV